MAYNKQNFTKGQVLEAEHLNNIESGIVANEEAIAKCATEEYVGQKIAEAQLGGGEVDLSAYPTKQEVADGYQPKGDYLTEHQPIKTINGQSMVGEGNIIVSGEGGASAQANIPCNLPLEMGSLNATIGTLATTYYGSVTYRTVKYLRVLGNYIGLKASVQCMVNTVQYDKDFKFISAAGYITLTANKESVVNLDDNCEYVRFQTKKNDALSEWDVPVITATNTDGKEYFDVRPANNGTTLFAIPINVANPKASDAETWSVQDTRHFEGDYGVLALPETYSNVGKPTRLIIYCHGGAVKYDNNTKGFATSDCRPEYWLAEGYAVLDIDGNPYSRTEAHRFMPAAKQSYLYAYEWATRNYNLRTDGVFLGGRSLGGGMTLELMRSTIPVIAACPVAMSSNPFKYLHSYSAANRKFIADNYGFTGTQPTWTSENPMTETEEQYFKDNFDKLVRYTPFLSGIENMPDKDELFRVAHVSTSLRDVPEEKALFDTLRFKAPVPVKIFVSREDPTAIYERDACYVHRMICNSGQICELRTFSTDGSDAHHFELTDSRAMTNVTTIYGKTMSAPLVYVEMLQFWRRYEKTV